MTEATVVGRHLPAKMRLGVDVLADGTWSVLLVDDETHAVWGQIHPEDFLRIRNAGEGEKWTMADLKRAVGIEEGGQGG
jgi:hypothetical protein